MQTWDSVSIEATSWTWTAPQLPAAPGAHGMSRQVVAGIFPGQREAAWMGNLGKTDIVTVTIA